MAPTTGTGGGRDRYEHAPRLGPAYLGEEEYQKQLEEANRTGGGILGPAFAPRKDKGNQPANAGKHIIKDREGVISLSVKELGEKLEIDPGLVEPLFTVELERPNGPRKSALASLIFIEQTKKRPDDELLERMRKAAGIETTDAAPSDGDDPAGGEGEDGDDEENGAGDTPPSALEATVEDLPAFLEDVTDVELILSWREADERSTATAIYQARLDELAQADGDDGDDGDEEE